MFFLTLVTLNPPTYSIGLMGLNKMVKIEEPLPRKEERKRKLEQYQNLQYLN